MKANLKARKTDPAIAPLACNFYALRRVWNQAKQKATPWWRQCSKETYECGIADLVAALQNWSDANVRRPLRQLQLRGSLRLDRERGGLFASRPRSQSS